MDHVEKREAQQAKKAEQLAECAREARRQAILLPDGPIRDALLRKIRLYEAKMSVEAKSSPEAKDDQPPS